MTKEQVVEMFALRVEGYSLEEIGKRYSVTREWVRQCLDGHCKNRRGRPTKCIYPGLNRWIVRNDISVKKMFEMTSVFRNVYCLRRCLIGEQRLTMEQIKDILRATGLTFEEAFGDEV